MQERFFKLLNASSFKCVKANSLSMLQVSSQISYLCKKYFKCCNPSLGLVTKAKPCKVVDQQGSPRVTSHVPRNAKECEGMNPHTPK